MSRQKRVVTSHDISCMGRCSITVALPILSSLGIETIILPTSILSTHTSGFEGFTFLDLKDESRKITKHWENYPRNIDAIYTGFLGSIEQIEILKEYISSMSKDTFVIVDPAMGDNGVLYKIFDNNYAQKMTELCMQASLVIPNVTEACFMTNTPYLGKVQTKEQIEDLINKINNLGIDNVVLTSVCLKEHTLGTATKTKGKEIVYQENQEIQGYFHGTGDVFGSALVGAYVNGVSLEEASKIAAEYVIDSIKQTVDKDDFDPKYGVNFELAIPKLIENINKKVNS